MSTTGWEAGVAKLEATDLTSAEACKQHLELFAQNLVSTGLAKTELLDIDDCLEVVATFVCDADTDVPHAAALKAITDGANCVNVVRACEYLSVQAKSAAANGKGMRLHLTCRQGDALPPSHRVYKSDGGSAAPWQHVRCKRTIISCQLCLENIPTTRS
jgi:hypothetical protein